MGTHRPRIWRGGATSVALWALLATAATLELYEEVPPDPESDPPSYQDENSIETGGPVDQNGGPDLALAKDVLLYRLIKSLKESNPHHASKYRFHWPTDKHEPHHPHRIRSSPEHFSKDTLMTRLTRALRAERSLGFRSMDQMYRPQQKWKIKKGKSLGNQMVCYFKLCAFRSPV